MMDRMEEFKALDRELDQTPPELEFTVTRAKARVKGRRKLRWTGIPAGTLAACFAAFVLMINTIPTFALACSNVPLLASLAAAVDWSGSLKAAVENQYVQTVGQSRTENGITVKIEYVIVDQKQLNVFYTVEYEDPEYHTVAWLTAAEGTPPHAVVSFGDAENGELCRTVIDFEDESGVPDTLTLKVLAQAFPPGEDIPDQRSDAVEFTFTVSFDPSYTASGEIVPVEQWLELDGQRICVEQMEIYPTHARLKLRDDPENELRLVDLEFYLEDAEGNRYETEGGLVGRSDPDTGFAFERRVSSPWFARSREFTLHITGVSWLDEQARTVTVDLDSCVAGGLPEGMSLEKITDDYGALGEKVLVFRVPRLPGGAAFTPFDYTYTDPEGVTRTANQGGTEDDGADTFRSLFFLGDYSYDSVTLTLNRTAWHRTEEHVTMEIG